MNLIRFDKETRCSELTQADRKGLAYVNSKYKTLQVKKNDQMPQNICSLCADKINDFYEYREMCTATNKQTRRLLGLPEVVPPTTKRKKKNEKVKKNHCVSTVLLLNNFKIFFVS